MVFSAQRKDMAGGNIAVLLTSIIRQKRAVLGLIFLTTVFIIVVVANVGQDSAGSKRNGSLAALVNWAQLGHQEDDAESRGESRLEAEENQPVFGVAHGAPSRAGSTGSAIPHYLSPEERLKRIAATFTERGLGDENVCAAIKRGEIEVDRHKRRGGKKSAWLANWKDKKVVVKRNDFEVNVALNKHLFYAWDRDGNGRVDRIEFFKSLSNALERMGIYGEELDNVFHTADVNRDGALNMKEVLLGAAIVYERYNQKLAPEALILGENPDLKIFPRYYGHCNNSYVVEYLPIHSLYMMRQSPWKALILGENPDLSIFPNYHGHCNTSYLVEYLPIHSLHPMKMAKWPIRAKLALGLLDWANTAMEKGFYACDMILGNYAQGADGIVKINDLDQVHSREDVERWKGLPCTPGVKGVGCFDDGHCRMVCMNNGKCPIMPPHHNHKEICNRLFIKKQFLDRPPVRIAKDVSILARTCAHGSYESTLAAAKKLRTLLEAESSGIGNIRAPSFGGQVRYGKLLDVPSHDVPRNPADKNLMRGESKDAADAPVIAVKGG